MTKKRKQGLDDSFDMFLDTITNTFGGVLLIALLIVLMIRDSSDQAPQQPHSGSPEDAALVQSEIDALEASKSALAASLKVHEDFESDFQGAEVKALAQNLAQMTSKKAELEQLLNQMSSKTHELDSKKAGIKIQQEKQNQQLAELENKLKDLNDERAKETQARTRTINLPKESATSKSGVTVFFATNELFVLYKGADINRKYFESCSASGADYEIGGQYYRAKIGAGIPLDKQRLIAIFNQYQSSRNHFVFVVRNDSFEKFTELREQCVASGFEYRIIAGDGLITTGPSDGEKTQ